jgi:hypothetical protein
MATSAATAGTSVASRTTWCKQLRHLTTNGARMDKTDTSTGVPGNMGETVAHQFEGRLPAFVPPPAGSLTADSPEGFWWMHAARCSRPAAREMVAKLTVGGNALGVNTNARGISTADGSVFLFALAARHRHPHKIILFRQGDFYETIGFDAVSQLT